MKFWMMIMWGNDCNSDDDYMQLVAPGTHTTSSSDSGNDAGQRTVTHADNKAKGMGGESVKCV
jgi:hypothetical protein